MQTLYSVNELIDASENKLSIHTIKDYCRRGELHPCIYFEGNIVCIKEERFQDGIDKRDLVAHIETVSWSNIFKGYLSASNFINYIDNHDPDATDVFYNVEKIIEYISPIDPVPMLKPDEYLKAFPPKIDDDIQEKKWLREAYDFTGNVFRASEIVFHCNEVNQLLNLEKSKTQLKFLDYSDNKVLSKVAKSLYFSPLTAACLMTGDDPEQLEILKTANQKLYESKYPENVEALALILRAIEMGILKADSDLFINEIPLKEFLVERGYIITGFNKSHYDGTYFPYHYDKKNSNNQFL